MKRIAIFCDGTWNRHDAPNPTNVVRLAQAVKLTDDSSEKKLKQQVFYLLGVGSGRGSNQLAKVMDRVAGGALGWGLMDNVIDAYRNLIFCYEPGDEIYIFGFSRGAYTARSLAGLIRFCGILPRENLGMLPEAIREYKARSKWETLDNEELYEWRNKVSPYVVTSQKEFDWRMRDPKTLFVHVNIAFLGVWDTVGALGVPGFLTIAPMLNRGYQFHDARLSRSVGSARHAVAIDERRKTFPPTLWEDLDRHNRRYLNLPEDAPLNHRDAWGYRQEWFPGDHGSVGGGGDRKGLSAYSFEWIAQGAQKAGLAMDDKVLAKLREEADIRDPVVNKSDVGFTTKLLNLISSDRKGPEDLRDVSDAAMERVRCDEAYAPGALSKVIDRLPRDAKPDDLLPPGD